MKASGTLSKVRRLLERADAAALCRRRPLRLDDLTEAPNERLDHRRTELETISELKATPIDGYDLYTDDQLIQKMFALGMVTVDDFKPEVVQSARLMARHLEGRYIS
jgi:hypothetical protein